MFIQRSLAALITVAAALVAAAPVDAQTAAIGEQLPGGPAQAQSYGFEGPFGDQPVLPAPGEHPAQPTDAVSPWNITPRITLSETATDNARDTATDRTADLITTINPSVTVTGDTQLAKVDLNYSPIITRNLIATDQDSVTQNFFGTGTLSLIPESLFIEARGSAFESSRGGSLGAINPTDIQLDQRTQTLAYDVSPIYRFPFLSNGTGSLRYTLGQVDFYDNTGLILNQAGAVTSNISDATQQELRASLDTGQTARLVSSQLIADGLRLNLSDGGGTDQSGVLSSQNELRLTPDFSLLGSVGWESQQFSQLSSANINDATWYGGFRFEPMPDSHVSLTYGHRDGINTFQGDLRYAISPLTTLYASYGESLVTPQQQILANLNQSGLSPNGSIVNAVSGLPLGLVNNELALQNGIYRDNTLQGGVIAELLNDRAILSGIYETQTTVAGAPYNDSTLGGDLRWEHAINPTTGAYVEAGYYVRQVLHENTADLVAGVGKQLSDTLTGSLSYELDHVDSNLETRAYWRNMLTLSLEKVF